MKKILVICGPTATGKTSLALHLSKVFNGEIVSADSRQVYKGLDIGTGKDLPVNSNFHSMHDKSFIIPISKLKKQNFGYYEINGIRLWGYDLVDPNEEFSVGQYIVIASRIIKDIHRRNKLPILVGGSGLYIQGVIDGIPTSDVPRDINLRMSLEKKDTDELFQIFVNADPKKALMMNLSDKKNPRRLIRAIEVSNYIKSINRKKLPINRLIGKYKDVLMIGIKTTKEKLGKRIEERVRQRIHQGIESEIEELISSGVSWNMQSMNTLGYKEWKDYFDGINSKEDIIKKWMQDEKNYAKRQMTWFSKEKRINWFDIDDASYIKKVERLTAKWYY